MTMNNNPKNYLDLPSGQIPYDYQEDVINILRANNILMKEAANCLADCLYQLYEAAGLDKPEPFDPDVEAPRLIAALAAVKEADKSAKQ